MARTELFLSAEDFNGLKALVKQECMRRNQLGDVSGYGGAAYDYTQLPAKNAALLIEHYSKLYTPLAAINSSGLTPRMQHDRVVGVDLDTIADKLAALSQYAMAHNAETGCAASCTGLCTTGCHNQCIGCTSCTGTCTGSCTSCSGNCAGGCYGCEGCGSGCAGCSGCGNSCGTGCGSDCQLVNCSNTCVVGCSWTGKPECLLLESEESVWM